MTHTPEQWNHGKCGNNADQWDIYDEAGRTIGLSYHGEDTAKLFASAPDLLAAAQAGLECLELTLNRIELNNRRNVIISAISKATE